MTLMHINGFLDLDKNLSSSPTNWIVLQTSSLLFLSFFYITISEMSSLLHANNDNTLRTNNTYITNDILRRPWEKDLFFNTIQKTGTQFYYWNSVAKEMAAWFLNHREWKKHILNSTLERFLFSSWLTSMSNGRLFFFFLRSVLLPGILLNSPNH